MAIIWILSALPLSLYSHLSVALYVEQPDIILQRIQIQCAIILLYILSISENRTSANCPKARGAAEQTRLKLKTLAGSVCTKIRFTCSAGLIKSFNKRVYHSSWLACRVHELSVVQTLMSMMCLFLWLPSILINPGNHVKMQEGTLGFFIASDAKEVKR